MKKLSYLILYCTAAMAMLTACQPDHTGGEGEFINTTINSTPLELESYEAGSLTFHIRSNMRWMITKDSGWVDFEPSTGEGNAQVTMTYTSNADTNTPRTVNFIITGIGAGDNTVLKYTLVQPGLGAAGEHYLRAGSGQITGIPSTGVEDQTMTVIANVPWHVTKSDDWIRLTNVQGTGNGDFRYTILPSQGERRRGTIKLSCTDSSVTVSDFIIIVEQNSMNHSWLELPEIREEGNLHYSVLYTPITGNPGARNYSMLYDYNEKIAFWVAYPMHPVYLTGKERSNKWRYNPDIDTKYQANGYNGYDKGHQIASADRPGKGLEINLQTFYYTNITPQIGSFNQGIWANLENTVRNWTRDSRDTVYVVTGPVLNKPGENREVKRESKNNVVVPNYYFKVILKKKSNSDTEYTAIGFWFDQYTDRGTPSHSYSYTVDQIEEWTGLDFFANLPEDVQSRVESVRDVSEWRM